MKNLQLINDLMRNKYWIDKKEYNASDVDAFYDFWVEFLKKKKTETNNE